MSHYSSIDRVDKKVFSHFEIIASFFVDVFTNSLYLKAIDQANDGKSNSITESYRRIISIGYPKAIAIRDHYRKVIILLHEYYCRHTGRTIGFIEFEARILEQFIPKRYLNDYRPPERENTLYNIIIECVNNFARFMISQENIRKVIDLRDSPEFNVDIETMKEHIRAHLITTREAFYERFLHETTVETVPKTMLDRAHAAAADVLQARDKTIADLRATHDTMRTDIAKFVEEIKQLKSIAGQLYSELNESRRDNVNMKAERARLLRIISKLVAKAEESRGMSNMREVSNDDQPDDDADDAHDARDADNMDKAVDVYNRDNGNTRSVASLNVTKPADEYSREISDHELKEMQKIRRQEMLKVLEVRPAARMTMPVPQDHSIDQIDEPMLAAPEVLIDETMALDIDEPIFGS